MNMNGLTTDMIYPGQILKIPADQNAFSQTYTVQEGDTLWKIATNFLGNGNRYTEIMSLNDLQNGDLIVGQSLRIPAK
jgi:nucleoid-associated protein YgaU